MLRCKLWGRWHWWPYDGPTWRPWGWLLKTSHVMTDRRDTCRTAFHCPVWCDVPTFVVRTGNHRWQGVEETTLRVSWPNHAAAFIYLHRSDTILKDMMCTVFFLKYSVCSRKVVALIIWMNTSGHVLLCGVASLCVCMCVCYWSFLQCASTQQWTGSSNATERLLTVGHRTGLKQMTVHKQHLYVHLLHVK